MSTTHVGARLRRLVALRADYLCEYCLIHESHTFVGCEVDHIISEKHGGRTVEANLAYACLFCNRSKGSDIGTLLNSESEELIRLYNPRSDRWSDHFFLSPDGITIEGRTEIGKATIRLLSFNTPERLIERRLLRRLGLYPTDRARKLIEQPENSAHQHED